MIPGWIAFFLSGALLGVKMIFWAGLPILGVLAPILLAALWNMGAVLYHTFKLR